ncbi:MAG: hypothetical protein ACXVPQ_11145, partial [Bacteroidia bacterium]
MKYLKLLALLLLFGPDLGAQINVIAEIDHVKPDGIDTHGNFHLTVSGGTSPYTYTWMPGSVTARDYTNATISTYTVKVKDSTPDSVYYYYRLGYKTRWTDFVSCVFSNDSIFN